jgi:hypothetical protein
VDITVNAVGRPLSNTECAYIAGFLDGDGAIMAAIEKHPEKRFRFRVRVAVKATQLHERDVAWLPKMTGIGLVRPNRSAHEWIVRNQKDIVWLLEALAPFLRSKFRQAEIALTILKTNIDSLQDLCAIAHLADQLATLNVRSKNRRLNFAGMICVAPVTTDSKEKALQTQGNTLALAKAR